MLHSDILIHYFLCLLQALVDMAPKYILEQFLETELLVNITEHEVGLRIMSSVITCILHFCTRAL